MAALTDRRGPLADSYRSAVVLTVLALTPYLALTTATQPLQELIGADLGMSMRSVSLGTGLANAAYSFGSVLAVALVMRFPPRRVLLATVVVLVVGSALVAGAWGTVPFVAGHCLQGLATGLLLVVAVPPLITNFGTETVPATATTFNLGLFGAVSLGPVLGGASAATGTWRPLFGLVGVLGLVAAALAVLTFQDEPPKDRERPFDWRTLALAGGGSAALFFGVSELADRRLTDAVVLLPALPGVGLLAGLFVREARVDDPLVPVAKLWRTLPLAGVLVVLAAGAGSVALVELAQLGLDARGLGPLHAGFLFWPQFLAAAVAAAIFARTFETRWLPVLTLAGMACIVAGGLVLTGVARGGDGLVLAGSALVGLGVGASVSSGFYVAAFTVDAEDLLPRVFAVVELLRGAAAFTVPPLLLQLAMTAGGGEADGIRAGGWIATAVVALGGLGAVAVWRLGRARLQAPAVEPWLEEGEPAVATTELDGRRTPAAIGVVTGVLALVVVVAMLAARSAAAPPPPPPIRLAVVAPPGVSARAVDAAVARAGAGVETSLRPTFLPARAALEAGRLDAVLVLRADGSRRLYLRARPRPGALALRARL